MSTRMAKEDYYRILEVERDASPEEIKRAYRRAAMRWHPDRNSGDPDAERRFKLAAEAYEVLSDPDKRARYDRFGHEGVKGAYHTFRSARDIFDMFGDILGGGGLFGDFFGGGMRRGPRAGASLKASVDVTLEEVAHGATKTLEITRNELCARCGGSRSEPGSRPAVCSFCRGHGQIDQGSAFFTIRTTCPQCRGEGRVVTDPCNDCGGTGRARKAVTLSVKIPAGIHSGQHLSLGGEGEPGESGAPRGDLYVEVRVLEHEIFERREEHLLLRVPVSFTQAALGTEIEVPTIDGDMAKVTVKRGTQHGTTARLKGQGLARLDGRGRGDQLVELLVEVPRKLTRKAEDLLRQYAEIEDEQVGPERRGYFDKVKEFFGEG
jgi:molecular chaperone DnaJ